MASRYAGAVPLPMHLPQPQANPPARRAQADNRTPIEYELEDPEHESGYRTRLSKQRHPEQAPADPNAVTHQGHQTSGHLVVRALTRQNASANAPNSRPYPTGSSHRAQAGKIAL